VRDSSGHGTNVSAIVLGVAPSTKILALVPQPLIDVSRAKRFRHQKFNELPYHFTG
jgi:hypothetical protein